MYQLQPIFFPGGSRLALPAPPPEPQCADATDAVDALIKNGNADAQSDPFPIRADSAEGGADAELSVRPGGLVCAHHRSARLRSVMCHQFC